ncbi:MAG: SPOR domain-containing protein [Acidobacteriota bacterium]
MARRGSGGALFEGAEEKRDRELTLGPGTLAILGIGLLTLCGVCFTFGYAVGHRSPGITPGLQQAIATTSGPSLPASNQPKPSASEDPFVPAPQTAAAAAGPAAPTAQAAVQTTTTPAAVAPATASSTTPAPAVVQTALTTTPGSGQSAGSNGLVHPALPQGSGWVVQVAAVSQAEDANVLLTALRRRGYEVSVRHDPADNLMHVQVGPFATHNDAANMRQRLLNDGYNAIIQP